MDEFFRSYPGEVLAQRGESYRVLRDMADAGLIERAEASIQGKPYVITDEGRRYLEECSKRRWP